MVILVTLPCDEADKRQIETVWPDAQYRYILSKDLTAADVADVEISLGNLPPALLPACQ